MYKICIFCILLQQLTHLVVHSQYSNYFNYDYQSPFGPLEWRGLSAYGNEWEKEFPQLDAPKNECKSTRRPSPVNLIANTKCTDNHEILTRKINRKDCRLEHLSFSITSSSLRATIPSEAECKRPKIDLPNGLPSDWILQWLELHIRSEHVLDGRRYDGELQMMHLGTEGQVSEVAIVSVLLDASSIRDEPKMQKFIVKWQEAADEIDSKCGTKSGHHSGQTRQLRTGVSKYETSKDKENVLNEYSSMNNNNASNIDQNSLNQMLRQRILESTTDDDKDEEEEDEDDDPENRGPRRKMFPYDMWPSIYYYRYKGSITQPPCSEIVQWRVLDEPLRISRKQLKQLGKILNTFRYDDCRKGSVTNPLTGENFRPLQELNNEQQEVTHCTNEDFTFWMYKPSGQ